MSSVEAFLITLPKDPDEASAYLERILEEMIPQRPEDIAGIDAIMERFVQREVQEDFPQLLESDPSVDH